MQFSEDALKYVNLGINSEMWAPYKDILGKEGLPDIDELVQDTHKELLSRIRGIATKREVLEMALSLEKEAVALFSDASAKSTNPEIRKVFDFLTGFERNHVQLIEKELATL